jgi:hypothetical protein
MRVYVVAQGAHYSSSVTTLIPSPGKMPVDLHVHSRCSEPSTEWFMERWNIAESYSDPLRIYDKATKAGMSLVTLTDHNSIEGCLTLKERFGDRVFVGVECTASFPEDDCRVHILVYDIDEQEFAEIQRLRKDIYELRGYLREKDFAHSVAHATYSVQPGKLSVGHLEKLIVLFNTFEVINGGRNRSDNEAWRHILENLTPDHLRGLCRKHSLAPFDSQPWIKTFTAGSDDHGGIFVGRTYTEVEGGTVEQFLRGLRGKGASVGGRRSDYQTLAFSAYKVMHDSFRKTGNGASSSLLGRLADALFGGKKVGFANRLRIRSLKLRGRRSRHEAFCAFHHLADTLSRKKFADMDEAITLVYSSITRFSDGFLRLLFTTLGRDMAKLDRGAKGPPMTVTRAFPPHFPVPHLSLKKCLNPFATSVKSA